MAKLNSVQIKEAISKAQERANEIINLCKTEVREMTEEEEQEFKSLREEIDEKKEELEELKAKLREYEEEVSDEEEDREDEEKDEEKEKCNRNKSKRNKMKKTSLIKEIRSAIENNKKAFSINAETRAMQVTGDSGVHDAVVETEIQGILEPLYANSVLSQLGARWYTGLPKGDVAIPIMGKGSCGWAGEIETAGATGNTFSTKKLQPKRLSAVLDISKQLIAQDTIGVEAALRRDLVNALNDKLEATIFGTADKTDGKPAGIFYDVEYTKVANFKDLCQFESTLDDENINGAKKYLLGNGAKAFMRSTIKGTANVGMIMEGNTVDGTPAYNTTNVAGGAANKDKFAYGDWNFLAIGSWGDLEITVDPYTKAADGQIRLVINAFFDAVILRPEAFAFGKVVDESQD